MCLLIYLNFAKTYSYLSHNNKSYVLCRPHIGLLLSEKEVFLEFFGGILPENGDVEWKSNFWNFMYIFKNIFFGFSTLLLPYAI